VDPRSRILYHTGSGLLWIGATIPGGLPKKLSDWLNGNHPTGVPETSLLSTSGGKIHIRAVPTSSPERRLLVLTRENMPSLSLSPTGDCGLSRRQSEVADWVCQGKTNAEIAIILGISPRTVQKHIEHIFEKMGVGSRMALAALLNEKDRP